MERTCHILLGLAASGRHDLLRQLCAEAADDGPVAVLHALEEPEFPDGPALASDTTEGTWSLEPGEHHGPLRLVIPESSISARTIFLVGDGRDNPIDFLEAASVWLPTSGFTLGRILTIVHCGLAEKEPGLRAFHEACIHFSDYVMLGKREGVSNKWIGEFQRTFKEACLPSHLELLKGGAVKSPAFVLMPEPRRMSQAFDLDESAFQLPPDVKIFDDTDDEDAEADEAEADDEAVEQPQVEHYFERLAGGRRVKELPKIAHLVP
jgi:hypothetical protein